MNQKGPTRYSRIVWACWNLNQRIITSLRLLLIRDELVLLGGFFIGLWFVDLYFDLIILHSLWEKWLDEGIVLQFLLASLFPVSEMLFKNVGDIVEKFTWGTLAYYAELSISLGELTAVEIGLIKELLYDWVQLLRIGLELDYYGRILLVWRSHFLIERLLNWSFFGVWPWLIDTLLCFNAIDLRSLFDAPQHLTTLPRTHLPVLESGLNADQPLQNYLELIWNKKPYSLP